MHSVKTHRQLALLFLIALLLVGERLARGQEIDSTPKPAAPDSMGIGLTTAELRSGDKSDNIGFRIENPGAFLNWPLPSTVPYTSISVIPDSPWTENFLGISDCPKYPPMIDNYYWGWNYPGQFATYALSGTTKDRVRFKNVDNNGLMYNFFACYRATSPSENHLGLSLPDHAGTDISATNGTAVLAASFTDEIYVVIDSAGDYRLRLRHPDVNGSGQTWYTYYVHMSSSAFPLGVTIPPGGLAAGTQIGGVGNDHLHFQAGLTNNYSNAGARNIWGIDQSPWTGCLWKDASLCPVKSDTCCGCGASSAARSSGPTTLAGMMQIQGPPVQSTPPAPGKNGTTEQPLDEQPGPELPEPVMLATPSVVVEAATAGFVYGEHSLAADEMTPMPGDSLSDSSRRSVSVILAPPASANYKLVHSVMGMGGGAKTSSSYRLLGTSGQPFATGLRTSSNYRLNSGYWGTFNSTLPPIGTPTPTATPIPEFDYNLNLPVVIKGN